MVASRPNSPRYLSLSLTPAARLSQPARPMQKPAGPMQKPAREQGRNIQSKMSAIHHGLSGSPVAHIALTNVRACASIFPRPARPMQAKCRRSITACPVSEFRISPLLTCGLAHPFSQGPRVPCISPRVSKGVTSNVEHYGLANEQVCAGFSQSFCPRIARMGENNF